MAVAGEKRPCISSIISGSGPMASPTPPTSATARRLEGCYPRAHHLPGAREVVAAHPLYEVLDPERVVADHVPRAGLREVPHERVGVVDHPRLAEAGQALVGVQPHDGQVA